MKRDISAKDFDDLSKEKKKQYIAGLLIRESEALPVQPPKPPIALVMAGLPGAGKTEFLDTLEELLTAKGFAPFVRIDLDQIVTVFPHYTPKSYDKFRSQGNYALARCIDTARKGRYNMMIDGTFSGSSGASVSNLEKLLESGYIVDMYYMYYMYDNALTAWNYTKAREIETKRGITKKGFLQACKNIQSNLKLAATQFREHEYFKLNVVMQKELRDKDYKIISVPKNVDSFLEKGYNIDKLSNTL